MNTYPFRFRDPVHGFIHLSGSELKAVESQAFRRLRNIKQLALTYLVYPGAMHTRFEHSLGVMELATKAFDALTLRSKDQLEQTFNRIGMTIEQARMLLRATALLHDVGHLPFSHGSEEILPKKPNGQPTKHEEVSIAVIRDIELSTLLENEFYSGITENVVLLLGGGQVPPELLILKKLISGQFDADRMDYLIRDSLHCGVGYGNFDYLRLLETLLVKDSQDLGLELAIDRGGIHTLEAMMLARYWMFNQVYLHKTRRIFDIYLLRYLKAWYQDQYNNLVRVLEQDDLSIMTDIRRDAQIGGNADRQRYARRIVNRNHHHVVYETTNHADGNDVLLTVALEKRLRLKYADIDFILDRDSKGIVHKFYVKGDEDMGDEFPVRDSISKKYHRLSEESSIFETIPKIFHVIRIYADVPKDELSTYRDAASNIMREQMEVI
jgi:uncharacterized protein